MTSARSRARRTARLAIAYALPALLLAWLLGGQMLFGRIDAALAIPLLMPGALWLAWLIRGESIAARVRWVSSALLALMVAQASLHYVLGGRLAIDQLLAATVIGALCCGMAAVIVRYTAHRHAALRWPAMIVAAMLWFALGQGLIGHAYAPRTTSPLPDLAVLTGLPLRWAGGDLSSMLEAGPADAPAVIELEKQFTVRLIDGLAEVSGDDNLLIAHPRALAPAQLVRLDGLTTRPRTIVILADALSSWSPPHPLGDPRNPPVTSLLTPLLDHWGITLAAPDRGRSGQGGDIDVLLGPGGPKLRLHSAGRFTRLPEGCVSYGGRRVARCPIGQATVWLVSDADMLHESLWQPPIAEAPWLRRSDNLAWLAAVLKPAGGAAFDPLWIGR